MRSNSSIITDEDGKYSDWIEIYNSGASVVNFLNWSLTYKEDKPAMWNFTSIIQPNSFFVFTSGKDCTVSGRELSTNFKIGSDNEYLELTDNEKIVSSELKLKPPENNINPTVTIYSNSFSLANILQIKTRLFYRDMRSALSNIVFIVKSNLENIKITEINYHPLAGAGQDHMLLEFI